MAIQVRFLGDVAILGGIGGLMNDPRHFDTGRDLDDLLDAGCRRFVLELVGVRDISSTLLGLMVTLTRQIRRARGEIVLARVPRPMRRYLETMQMDEFWDIYPRADDAARSFARPGDAPPDPE